MNIATSNNSPSDFPNIPLVCFDHDKNINQRSICQSFKERLIQKTLSNENYKQLLWTYSTCLKMIENGNNILSANLMDVENDPFEVTIWLFSQKKSMLSLQIKDHSSEAPMIIYFNYHNKWNEIITSSQFN